MSEAPDNRSKKSALNIMPGVRNVSQINPAGIVKARPDLPPPALIVEGILRDDRVMLGRAISLLESRQEKHKQVAAEIVDRCLPYASNTIRIGITGVPGVGKSTFIEAFGIHLIEKGHRVAVLAIDPSSARSGGSILGDKTRMARLSSNDQAFIRPTPTSGSLGGVARTTRETMVLVEAAGYDVVIIETVGVGQSETAVHSMVDFFLLLLLPGGGDELQGIKRGIVEMADAIAVNKADGKNLERAEQSKRAYKNALRLYPHASSGWHPSVVTCSAQQNQGIDVLWSLIEKYTSETKASGFFQSKRQEQARAWMEQTIDYLLREAFFNDAHVKERYTQLEQAVMEEKMSPFQAAKQLLLAYRGSS